MSPSANGAGMELPTPVVDKTPKPDLPLEAISQEPEMSGVSAMERDPLLNLGAKQTMPQTQAIPMPTQPVITTDDNRSSDDSLQTNALKVVQDKDLIEKEWVDRAKAIVESTREDPYKQSESLTMLKSDYMRKQFNKTIKLNK